MPPCEPDETAPAMAPADEQQAVSGDADCVIATPQPPMAASCDVTILSEHRQVVTRTRTHQAHAVGRWAAAMVLLAITLGFAAALPFGLLSQYAHQLGGMLRTMLF
jgi:hypothetical protein